MISNNRLFKKLNTKGLLLVLFSNIIIASLFIYLYLNNIFGNEVIFFIVTTVSLFIIMIIANEFTTRFFDKRMANKKYNTKYYELEDYSSINKVLLEKKAVTTKYDFGTNYMIVENKTAYRICIINNTSLYFERNTETESKPDERLKDCTKFYGYEIFEDIPKNENELNDLINKIALFTFQSENVCYNGLYYDKENSRLVQPQFDELKESHSNDYYYLFKLLNCNEVEKKN